MAALELGLCCYNNVTTHSNEAIGMVEVQAETAQDMKTECDFRVVF